MRRSLIFTLPALLYILLIVVAVARHQPAGGENPGSTTTSDQTPTPSPPGKSEADGKSEQGDYSDSGSNLREGVKTIAEGSRALSGWSLLIIGASIVAIVSTSYFRPINAKVRLIYLLFIPGWFLVGYSMYYGDMISRRHMASVLAVRREVLFPIFEKVNSEFDAQLSFLQRGLLVFSVWLILYLIWWVFGSGATSTTPNK